MFQYVCTTSWRAWRTNAAEPRTRMSCSGRGSSRWRSRNKHCTTSWRGPKRWAKGCGRMALSCDVPVICTACAIDGPNHPREMTHTNYRRCEKSLSSVCLSNRIHIGREFTRQPSGQKKKIRKLVLTNSQICFGDGSDTPTSEAPLKSISGSSSVKVSSTHPSRDSWVLIVHLISCSHTRILSLWLSWNRKWMLSPGIHVCVFSVVFFPLLLFPLSENETLSGKWIFPNSDDLLYTSKQILLLPRTTRHYCFLLN